MGMTRRLLPAALIAALAIAPGIAEGARGRADLHKVDRAQDCGELQPVAYDLAGITDDGATVSLDVLVLVDGIDRVSAKEAFDTAARSYSPLRITLAPRFRPVQFLPEETTEEGIEFARPGHLIEEAKTLLGGARPKGIDVVYVMTDKDVGTPESGDTAGYSDCIGGIRYPDRAFAVGEGTERTLSLGVMLYGDAPAKIAGHEIAHLLGAQHHYQSCVEGLTTDDASGTEFTPCTLMTNYVELQSLNFGVVEGAVIRGHAVEFAAP